MDSEGSDIDVTELDDCLKELDAINISDLELSDNEQNLDADKLAPIDEDVCEKTESKTLEISEEKISLSSCEVERSGEFELEGGAKINYPSHCSESGEDCEKGKTKLSDSIEDENEGTKPKMEFQTHLSVTELRQILSSTVNKAVLEDRNKSQIPLELSDATIVVKDSVTIPNETKREEIKQLASTLMQHMHLEPVSVPEITLTPKFSPVLEEIAKKKHPKKEKEEDDSCRLDEATVKLGTIVKEEAPESVPEDTEAILPGNESAALLKRASSEASLSSCETVIFERRSPIDDQRSCRKSSSDIEEVILVQSILKNLQALEACDSLEAISPDSMASPPPIELMDKAVTAELSENDVDYKDKRRKRRRRKKKTKKRHDKKKREDAKDGLSDASSISSDENLAFEKKPLGSLNYLENFSSKKRSPSHKTLNQELPSVSPNCSLPLPPTKQLSPQISLRRSPHSFASLSYKPRAVHCERKLGRDGSSSSPSPSRSRHGHKKHYTSASLKPFMKRRSAVTSRSPTHSPPHRTGRSRYTKKKYERSRSRSKSPLWKRRYRRRSRSRSYSPRSRKYSTTARQKYPERSRKSESPIRLSPDIRSNSPLERKISRRLKKLASLRKVQSRGGSKSRSTSPKVKQCTSTEKEADCEILSNSRSPKKSPSGISNSTPAKNIAESVKEPSSPRRPLSRQSSSPKKRISPSPVVQQASTCTRKSSPCSGPIGKAETQSESLTKPSSPSPEEKIPPAAVKCRTPSPPAAKKETSKPEPMDISPTPEMKLVKETPQPVLNTDFTKLPPVPSLVMQLPSMWNQPPPPGTLPVCDTHVPPPPHGTVPLPYGVQQLPSASTTHHPLPLQSQQQQQIHSSFSYSHPQLQGMYQNASSGFVLPDYSQNNNQSNYQQQPLYGQSGLPIGCQTFTTYPQVSSNSSNTQFKNVYGSPVNQQDMSVPPPVYNQSQQYQPNLVSHSVVQYPPPAGKHSTPYTMQSAQQAQNIMQSPQNIPHSQTQIKINVQQVLHPQNTNNPSLTRTSPYASCRDPRLKDINISVSCETPIQIPSIGTQLTNTTVNNQSSASLTQKELTPSQNPLPAQPSLPPGELPPLPPGDPPLPPGQPPLPPGQPPLPPGQPPLPPVQPPLPPKEIKVEQPPLPKSPPPPPTPPSSKISGLQQDNHLKSSVTKLQQSSPLISRLQSNLKKLLPSKNGKNQELKPVTTTSASLLLTQKENSSKSEAFSNLSVTIPVCSKTVHATNSLLSSQITNIASTLKPLANDTLQTTSENKRLSAVPGMPDKNISRFIASVTEKSNSKSAQLGLLGSEQNDSQREIRQEQVPEYQKTLSECICEKGGLEKKVCLRCLYKKREKLEQASVFSKTPNLPLGVKRPIIVNLLNKRRTQPVTAIVKPNVHEIQANISSSEQPRQQERVTTASYSNTSSSETRTHDSVESVPILTEQRNDEQCGNILDDKSTDTLNQRNQINLEQVDASSSAKNSVEFPQIITEMATGQVSVTDKTGSSMDGSEKNVPEDETPNLKSRENTRETAKNDQHTSEIKESLKEPVELNQKTIHLNEMKSASVQMKNKDSVASKYLTYVITGNKSNKKFVTSIITGYKKKTVLPRTYRSKSAESVLDSEKQFAKECENVPKDDLFHAVGNSSLVHDANKLENNTLCPVQKTEENQNENNTSVSFTMQQINKEQKTNYTEKPSSICQIPISEKVEESENLNNREVDAASADQKSKYTIVMGPLPNNNENLDYISPKANDTHLSETKFECVSERPAQNIFGPTISVKKELQESDDGLLESDADGTEQKSNIIVESFPKLDATGGVDLESLCSVEKTKCHESIKSLNDNISTSPCNKLETEKLSTTTEISSENRFKLKSTPKNHNSDVAALVEKSKLNSSDSVMCIWEKLGSKTKQDKSFKNEKLDPSISMQIGKQSLKTDTEDCRQDERCIAVDSAPIKTENVLERPMKKLPSHVEGEKAALTAVVDDKVLDSLEKVQQPTMSVAENKSEAKEKDGLSDNVAPNVSRNLQVIQLIDEKSVCLMDEATQEKMLEKKVVKCEEEKHKRIKMSCRPERAVSESDSSDCDIIEMPPTIDLCLSDDADDLHEVQATPTVLPIVDITNDKPQVLSDTECITVDDSPKKEMSETNADSIAITPPVPRAPLIDSQDKCVSVTDSQLMVDQIPGQLDKTSCINSNLCKSHNQRNDKSLLEMKLEVSSDESKQPSHNTEVKLDPKVSPNKAAVGMSLQPQSPLQVGGFVSNSGEVTHTKPDISKSPPQSKPFITDTLLSQMKPAPRSIKLQHAAILQDKHTHDKLSDVDPVKGQKKSAKKAEMDVQSAVRNNETKDTTSFSQKKLKGGSSQVKRNLSMLLDNSNKKDCDVAAVGGRDENNPSLNIQEECGEPCLKKRKQSLIGNELTKSDETAVSILAHQKQAKKNTLSVTVLQSMSIAPSESREGTLSSQVQRYSSRIWRSPQKNTVIYAKHVSGTDYLSNEEDCSNEGTSSTQVERRISKSEKTIKKYPHRSQLPSYAVSRRVLISRLRRCPVVLQANLKKMAKLLRQDSKLTQIPLVILEKIDQQSEQSKKITQNLDLQSSSSNCCCCQVLCRSIATQTDSSSHAKQH